MITSARDLSTGWTAGQGVYTQATGITGSDGLANRHRQELSPTQYGRGAATAAVASGSTVFGTVWQCSPNITGSTNLWYIVDAAFATTAYARKNLSQSWERSEIKIAVSSTGIVNIGSVEGRTLGAPFSWTAAARDAVTDMFQVERGLFPTEFIWTSGSAQWRASEKLYHPDVTQLIDDGMLTIEIAFRPKGRFPTQFAGPVRIWTIDENNYSEVDPTGSVGRVCINGVTATFSPATLEMTTGYSLYTSFSSRADETPQYLAIASSSTGFSTVQVGAAMSAGFTDLRLPSTLTGSLYFMSDASGNKTLSAWIERISVYRRSRNVPDLELPATRHPTYTRTTRVRPFADRTRR